LRQDPRRRDPGAALLHAGLRRPAAGAADQGRAGRAAGARRIRLGVGRGRRRSLTSAPVAEAEAGARPCERAIARRVVHPLEVEMLERARRTNPVTDLGASRLELLAW